MRRDNNEQQRAEFVLKDVVVERSRSLILRSIAECTGDTGTYDRVLRTTCNATTRGHILYQAIMSMPPRIVPRGLKRLEVQ